MRVVLWHANLPEFGRKPGGVEVAVHGLANALAENRADEVTVFSLGPRPADAAYRHERLFANSPWLLRNQVARLFFLPFLLNFVRFEGFDVLHLHGDDWFYFRRPLPTVRTLNGSALREARTATSLKRKLSQYALYPLERLSARLPTIPLALGTDTAEIYDIDRVVDYGVDLRLFSPGEKAANPRILFVGAWEGRKRGKFIYKTFVERVLPRAPGAELYMVSDFCPPHPSVVFVEFPSNETLAELYRVAWVFALPSAYEGFGIPYLEALASGTAVVSSPNAGADRILAGGEFGIIAEDRSFGEHLVELIKDPSKRETLETAGRSRAQEFSWVAVADRHREAYAEAVSRKSCLR